MNRIRPKLTGIDHDHHVTAQTDPDFLRALMQGLLLTMREQGILTEPQLRAAEDLL